MVPWNLLSSQGQKMTRKARQPADAKVDRTAALAGGPAWKQHRLKTGLSNAHRAGTSLFRNWTESAARRTLAFALSRRKVDWSTWGSFIQASLREAVLLSLNFEPRPNTRGSKEYRRRLAIAANHMQAKRLPIKWGGYVEGPPEEWGVDLREFAVWWETGPGRELPPLPAEFPGSKASESTRPARPAGLVTISLPHTTKRLEALFEIIREYWADFDPRNPPKQTSIVVAIDNAMDWNPQGGKGSRVGQALANMIRPDWLAEKDKRARRK
jgi:hypothetical protein